MNFNNFDIPKTDIHEINIHGMNIHSLNVPEMFRAYGFAPTQQQLCRFEQLTQFMLDCNTKVNLTRITDIRDIYIRHYLDSLLLLSAVNLPTGASIIDVGSGAGFPALPLAIMRDDLVITALDSTKKKCDYIKSASEHISVKVTVMWGRAEDVKIRYDYAAARAVAPLPKLYKWCGNLAPVFIALKGGGDTFAAEYAEYAAKQAEYKAKQADYRAVNTKTAAPATNTRKFVLPDGSTRNIVVIRNVAG